MRNRVAVCISGGVDSALAALLLKREGKEVVGVLMKNWDEKEEAGSCAFARDAEDARFVARHLGFPLVEVDFVKEYWNEVFLKFLEGQRRGITPNPDILCNRHIKFGHLTDFVTKKLGIEQIATGHYARVGPSTSHDDQNVNNEVSLLCAADPLKDQTYFLATVKQENLQRVIFPLSDWIKRDVKKEVAAAGMERLVKKPEVLDFIIKKSQGICFIGKRDFPQFISQYVDFKEGPIVDFDSGKRIGSHIGGVEQLTVGQRVRQLSGMPYPYFVVSRDLSTNTIIVCPRTHHPALYATHIEIGGLHWIREGRMKQSYFAGREIQLKFAVQRNHRPSPCKIRAHRDNTALLILKHPCRAVSPGQHCALYYRDECLGGGHVLRTQTLVSKSPLLNCDSVTRTSAVG